MKDSWVSDTMIQEASLAMELPASPATANDLPINRITDQELTSRTINQKLPLPNTLDHSKYRGRDSGRRTENTVLSNEMAPPNQTSQPMDITDNVDCGEDEEQIVPQSVASCKISRQNGSEMTLEDEQREAANVSSRIMKMGLRDLLNEVDHEQGINKSEKSETSEEANVSTLHQQKKKAAMNTWPGFSQQEHVIFGPLSRPTTLHSDNHSAVSVPRNQVQVKEREGSPVITHKKFDYQKKLTLHAANATSAPLNLCKRSPSQNTPSCDVKDESTPIDLTTKKQNKTEYVQCSSFQNPETKSEPWPSAKKNQDYFQSKGFRSHFLFGIKPELDAYSPPRMPSFLLPRSSSCSPSSASDHSSSSTVSSTEQRSEPETSDVKPNPEMLSQLNPNLVPPQLRLDQDISAMPRVIPFDPSRVNDFYMQQFQTKLEGGVYPVPMTHFGGYTTATACPPQPLSPSSKNRNQKPDKMFICQECGAVFKHRHHVVRHMRSHSGERPFRCDECGATFARKCILTNHKRTHTGEKPYICTECGDTFSRKHHLVIHRRTHTGEKPYKCLHCGAAFARSHHLNRHRKTHVKLDVQGQGEISRMYLSQMPSSSFPLQGMQGLPTMLPILPPNMLPRAMDTTQELNEQNRGDIVPPNLLPRAMDTTQELNKQSRRDSVPPKLLPRAMDTTQELNEQNRGDIGDTSQAGLEQGTCQTNAEVSEKSTSDNIGAKDPASSKNQSLSD